MNKTSLLQDLKKVKVDNTNCCVSGCHSKKATSPNLSFHKFPNEKKEILVYITNRYYCKMILFQKYFDRFGILEKVDKHKAWMMELKMKKPATQYMRVCSLHFKEDDYFLPGNPTKKPRLKLCAIPSQNLPQEDVSSTIRPPRKPRKRKLIEIETQHEIVCKTCVEETNKPLENGTNAIQALLHLHSPISNDEQILLLDFDENIITSDKQLHAMTGIPSFSLFNTIVQKCEQLFGKFTTRNLPLKDCILLTLVKLKTAFSYSVLSQAFKWGSATTCRRIFHETVGMLAKVLRPSIEDIKPISFKSTQKTRIVIDCIEIPVERAKSLKQRTRTYSKYKKHHTIKFMIAVAQTGLITFVSKGYGGMCSNKGVFKHSGLTTVMHLDQIMVDRGFLIQDIADSCGIEVVQPTRLNREIAGVHIERVNQRIKIFDILKKPLPDSLWAKVDDIFLIACAIVNLANPVLDDLYKSGNVCGK